MALTQPVPIERHNFGTVMANFVTVTFDDSYPTGGEPLTAADCGLTVILFVIAPAAPYRLVYDIANSKLLAYYSDLNAAGDGPDIQVPDTTDLDPAITAARLLVLGR